MKKNYRMIAVIMVAAMCMAFTGCGTTDSVTVAESTEAGEGAGASGKAEDGDTGASAAGADDVKEASSEEKATADSTAAAASEATADSTVTADSEAKADSTATVASEATAGSTAAAASEATADSTATAASEAPADSTATAASEAPAGSTATADSAASETAADLPGINRNGRYADIPESVLPSSVAPNVEFVDEPIYCRPWSDVTGKIYADYMRTEVIKEAVYGQDDLTVIAYCGYDEVNQIDGNAIAIYDGQYVIINEALFAIWVNGINPEFN